MPRPREGYLSLIALGAMVLSPALSLVAADWTQNLYFVPWLALAALVVGTTLAKSRVPVLVAHPLALLVGGAASAYFVAGVIPGRNLELSERLMLLWQRLWVWYDIVRGGGRATDDLLFLLLLVGMAWFVGYFSAWSVYRDGIAWWPIIATGAALFVNTWFSANDRLYLVMYLLGALALIVRFNLLANENRWRARGLRYSSGIASNVQRVGLLAATLLVTVAWLAPPASAQQINRIADRVARPWYDARAEVERLMGTNNEQPQKTIGGFGDSLELSGDFRLPQTPVLQVQSSEPRYWRAITYQRYTGQGWTANDRFGSQRLAPGQEVQTPYDMRKDVPQTIRVIEPRGDMIVAAGAPRWVNTEMTLEVPGAGRQAPGIRPLAEDRYAVLRTPQVIAPGQEYQVISAATFADDKLLRQAGRTYPDWVRAQYLALPQIPASVENLAKQVTAGQTNAYDRAKAIEMYLRQMPYSLEVEPPPPGVDGVEYFLFTARTGYCDYFASAMTVMLRSVGVPARVASGYAVGEPQGDGAFLVRDSNAHSWVEVYFPRYGWVEFEPSAIQPPFQRAPDDPGAGAATAPTPTPAPESAPESQPATDTPAESPNAQSDSPWNSWTRQLPVREFLFVLVIVGAIIGAGWLALNWGTHRMPPAEAAYLRMARLAGWLGRSQHPAETPSEYALGIGRLAPAAEPDVTVIADQFARQRFARASRRGGGRDISRAWASARGYLLRAALRLRRRNGASERSITKPPE